MPKISVIIPVYNAERFLERTLESARAQTFDDFEVLTVDDGSTDSSASILRRFADADPRFRVLTRPNGGLSAARNTGIDAAAGEWLYFLDADDTMHPRSLETLLDVAGRTGVPLVIGGYFEASQENWPSLSVSPRSRAAALRVFSAEEILDTALYQRKRINSACGLLIKNDLLQKQNLRFAEGLYYEDLELFPSLCLAAGKIAYLPTPLYFYRQHPASFLHKFSPNRLDSLVVTDRILSLLERKMPELLPAARDRQMSAAFNVLLLLSRQKLSEPLPERYSRYGKDYREVADHCWLVIRRQRLRSLFDPHARLKNRLGALLSFFGRQAVISLSR